MQLSNTSELLLRNSDLFTATAPLLINNNADGIIDEYLQQNPTSKITCFNTNFEQYTALQHRHSNQITCIFNSCYQTTIKHDLVIIVFPKIKHELDYTLAMISPFLTDNANILFVGENKGGIKSTPKLTTQYLSICNKIDSARHCTLFSGIFNNHKKPFNIDTWFKYYEITIQNISLKIAALPGVFSQNNLDKGSELLLNNLPAQMQGEILDFGCGAGVIGCFIGKKYNDVTLSMIDISALALASTEKTLAINELKGKVQASNGLSHVKGKYKHIVSNPPFHQGIKTNYAATETFLKNIKTFILPQGSILIVANSFLRYQSIMEQAIGVTKILAKNKGFTIYQSQLKKNTP